MPNPGFGKTAATAKARVVGGCEPAICRPSIVPRCRTIEMGNEFAFVDPHGSEAWHVRVYDRSSGLLQALSRCRSAADLLRSAGAE